MKFSLKQYLTEKLQSSIIKDSILNDKGGTCKIYKSFYYEDSDQINANRAWDKAYNLSYTLMNMFRRLYNQTVTFGKSREYYRNYSIRIPNRDSIQLTDEKMIKAHALYMKRYNEFIKACKLLFTKPSSEVLLDIFHPEGFRLYNRGHKLANIDLANMTDDMFLKYTYTDIKANKQLYEDIITNVNSSIIFYMSHDNTLEAVLRGKNIRLVSPESYIKNFGLITDGGLTLDVYNKLKTGDVSPYTISTYVDRLSNGTILEFPIVGYYESDLLTKKINKSLSIYNLKIEFTPGKFLGKASKLQKYTNWGKSPEDYVLIYNPVRVYNSANHRDYFRSLHSKNRDNKRAILDEYVHNRFKWLYDMFGDIIPYGGGTKKLKSEKLYLFMSKIDNYLIHNAYNADQYCIKMMKANKEKYDALKTVYKSIRDVKNTEVDETYTKLQKDLEKYINASKTYKDKIFQKYNNPSHDLANTVQIYAAYSYVLNDFIRTMSKITDSLNKVDTYTNTILTDVRLGRTKDLSSSLNILKSQTGKLMQLMDNAISKYKDVLDESLNKLDEALQI